MAKVYIPDGINGVCYINSNDYVDVMSTNNQNTYNNGLRVFKNDYSVIPVSRYGSSTCDTYNTYTHDISYRLDLPNIFIMLFIFFMFLGFIFKLFLMPFLGIKRT